MTTQQMIIEVQQQLQKQGASKTRKFFDDEVLWALNKGQLKFRDSAIRRKQDNSGLYEIDQMHADALRVWTIEDQLLTQTTNAVTTIGTLPANYAYLLNASSDVLDKCNSQDFNGFHLVPNRMVNHSLVKNMQAVPYYKTKVESPLGTLSGNTIRVRNDENFTVKGIYIDYIRKPSEITLDSPCELPVEFHQAVCDVTVELLLVDIQDQRAQMKIQQNQIT